MATQMTSGQTETWTRNFWVGHQTEGRLTPSLPSGLVVLLAVWLGFAPFALHYRFPTINGAGDINDVMVALVVGVLAATRVVLPRGRVWPSVVNAVIGVWLIAAPFVLDYATSKTASATVNDVVAGVLLVILSGSAALMTHREHQAERAS